MGIDTAPFVAFISLLTIFFHGRLNLQFATVLVLISVAFFIDVLFEFNISKVKNYMQYIFCIVTIVSFSRLDLAFMITPRLLSSVVVVYLMFGLLQLVSFEWITEFLVPGSRGAFQRGRGVNSLTTEPSFYATVMMLQLLLLDKMRSFKGKRIIRFLIFFQIIFLARSALGLVLLSFYLFLTYTIQTLIIAVALLVLGGSFFLNTDSDLRVAKLFVEAQSNGLVNLVTIDQSVANRLMRVLGPVYALVADFGMPHLYSGWTETTVRTSEYFGIEGFIPDDNNRISGGLLPTIYHYGFFGLIAVVAVIRKLKGTIASKVSLILVALTPIIIFNPTLILVGLAFTKADE